MLASRATRTFSHVPGWLVIAWLALATPPGAETFDAAELIRRVEDVLRGDTAQMKATMLVQTPRWKRSVEFRSWDDRRGDRSFIRILSPAKDRGTGFLRVEGTFWTYLPRVERSMRIPPSMMLQPWMGSDFTNDDLARESSLVEDYTYRALGEKPLDGVTAWGIELLPREDAPVVWSRVEAWVDPERIAPLRLLYFDEPEPGRFELLRELRFSRIRTVQGRAVPHTWKMIPSDKPGHHTELEIESIAFDQPLDDALFTQQNLRRATGARE